MADTETPLDAPAPKPTVDMEAFGHIIGEAVAAGMAKNTPKKVTFGQFIARPTKLHPQGSKGPQLTRAYDQNGFRIDYDTTSDAEIGLLNRITHSGRYIDRKVEVVVNSDSSEETVSIRFNCRTPDQRFEIQGLVRNFEDMLRQIVKAQEAEDAENAERSEAKVARRYHIGDAKATREARERAEAATTGTGGF